ncbi:MAG: ATP synthase F1 subunit delta [Candidatus Gastranaerophilales bacterium]|nr:ATP synthase F1 subunit delta [Candidatus Gastranaerophilales bacterium]
MEKTNIKLLKTSKNYAAALFETAQSHNAEETVFSDIKLVTETILSNKELQQFLKNPVIKVEDKKSAVTEIFDGKLQNFTQNLLLLLADNARFELLSDICSEYRELMDKSKNIVHVKAVSAVEIKEHLKEKLKTKIESIMKKNAEIQYEINPEIIGGLIIEAEGKTIDSSVLTQLKNIKKQMI